VALCVGPSEPADWRYDELWINTQTNGESAKANQMAIGETSINRGVKQVLAVRTDLNMRKGKMVAQGAHASVNFLRDMILYGLEPSRVQIEWLTGGMTKICVGVDSEDKLRAIFDKARAAKLTVHLITDAGLTEFAGPTKTCLAIGPDRAEDIDKITGELKLL